MPVVVPPDAGGLPPADGAVVNLQDQAIGVLPGVDADTAADAGLGFANFIGRLLMISMTIAALLLLIYLVWGAIEWMSSGGDKGKLEKARGRITSAVIGIIVLAGSLAIFMLIQSFLGLSILTFTIAGSPGGNPGGNPGGTTCTIGPPQNDGGAGGYCTQGAAIVRCNPPDNHLPYNHNDPCSCVDGSQYQRPGYDFSAC